VPAFNEYKVSDIKPAIEVAIKEKLEETDAIANNPQAPNFENTIAALERSGKTLSRVMAVFGIYSSNMNSAEFEPIETEMTPQIYAVSNKVYQNKKLFQRIEKNISFT
jgi:peptidyl-dipeptidase Dcp